MTAFRSSGCFGSPCRGALPYENGNIWIFLEIAYGSLMETMSQLEIANDLKYIDKVELKNIEVLVEEEARLISGLRRSYQPEDSGL